MDDRDLLALELVASELGPDHALLVVAAAGAERVPQHAVGDLGICRRGRDKQDAVLGIDVGGRDRHAGVEMADDELDPVADELVGDRHALLRVGDVVARLDFELLPQNAARLVDVFGRLLDALGQLRPERRVGPGDRPRDADLDLRLRRACEPERQRDGNGLQNDGPHCNLPYRV